MRKRRPFPGLLLCRASCRSAGLALAALLLAPGSALLAACGPGADEVAAVAAPPPAVDARAAGRYAVEGVTVQALTGRQRAIEGTLDLDIAADRYQVEFELHTTAPDFEDPVPVTVRGGGRGFIVGRILTGTTEERMTLDAPPGTESRLPDAAGLELVSTSQGSFDPDGHFHVVLENTPRPGQRYEPSLTVLRGARLAESGAP